MTYASQVQADSPGGYWRLGEASGNALDSSANSNAGTPTGTLTRDVTGALTVGDDGAVTFGGGRFDVADHATLDFGNTFTIELWCKPSASGSYILSKGNQFNVRYVSNTIALDNDDTGIAFQSTVALNDSNWHHVVITHNGTGSGNTVIYIDGSAGGLTETAPTLSFSSNATGLTIGSYGGGTAAYSGDLDEVAVYSTVLSSSRVSAHYAARLGDATPTWTTPADTVSMTTTPELKFNSPSSSVKQHFYLQLDTANTFNTGNLRSLDSSTDQTNWAYYNGATWTALPSDGLPIAYAGNEVRYTVTSALSSATWYRRVRAGTLV